MTAALLALVLGQSLNLNQQPIMVQDEGVRQGTVRAVTVNCSGAGVTCTQSGSTMTMTIPGGGSGGGSGGGGAPVDGGYLTLTAGSTGSTNERVLSGGTNISISGAGVVAVSGTVAAATTASTATAFVADPSDCAASNYATGINASGVPVCSIPPGTYVLPNATNLVTGGIRLTTDLAGTATAPTVVDDSHAHTGTTISGLDTGDISTGTLPVANGGTNSTATPTNGGIGYGTGTAHAYSAAGAGGDCLKSGGAGAPTWGSCSSISAYSTIGDEGTPLTQRTTLNFVGAGVTCVDNAVGAETDCTIPGGGSGPTVQTARTTATHTIGSTTATEVTALEVSLAGAGTYDVRYNLRVRSSNVSNGYKFGVNVTTNLTTLRCVALHPTTGTTASTGVGDGVAAILTGNIYEVLGVTQLASTTAANLGPNTGVAVVTEDIPVRIECSVVTSGAGALELWMGSEAAVSVTTEANSYVVVTTIP